MIRFIDLIFFFFSFFCQAPNQAVRKRAMLVFGSLAAAVPDDKFAVVTAFLTTRPDFKKELPYARVFMQCIAVVA